MTDQAYYSRGYDSSVSKTHSWRTPENCCEYMLPLIKPTDKILDVGCGPGTITCGLSKYVPSGSVTGIEPTPELLNEAKSTLDATDIRNVDFQLASAYKLPFEDGSFDIIHCHQVLLHLETPELALSEMKRVVKPTGYVCCKDADIELTTVYPEEYNKTIKYYFMQKTKVSSTNPRRGRSLRELALSVGFELRHINASVSNWCVSNDNDRKWFSDTYINRITNSLEVFVLDNDSLNSEIKSKVIEGWKSWSCDEKGWFLIINGEIICQKNQKS